MVGSHLFIEVEEAARAVDIVEGGEAGDRAIYTHGMNPEWATSRHEQPMRERPTDEHLHTNATLFTAYTSNILRNNLPVLIK